MYKVNLIVWFSENFNENVYSHFFKTEISSMENMSHKMPYHLGTIVFAANIHSYRSVNLYVKIDKINFT